MKNDALETRLSELLDIYSNLPDISASEDWDDSLRKKIKDGAVARSRMQVVTVFLIAVILLANAVSFVNVNWGNTMRSASKRAVSLKQVSNELLLGETAAN